MLIESNKEYSLAELAEIFGLNNGAVENEDAALPRVEVMSRAEVRIKLHAVGEGITELLDYKQCKYKNSIFEPLEIFANADPEAIVTNHLNEKLARIKENHGENLKKNDVADLMGYLRFLCVIRGWTDFKDLMD